MPRYFVMHDPNTISWVVVDRTTRAGVGFSAFDKHEADEHAARLNLFH